MKIESKPSVAMAVSSLLTLSIAQSVYGKPSSVTSFVQTAQAVEFSAPESQALTPESSVGPTGEYTYTYPIPAPVGKNGIKANLALSYSSGNPVHGGIAAGWSLSIPHISIDHKLNDDSIKVQMVESFKTTFSGSGPLVRDDSDPEQFYALHDGSFAKYRYTNADSSSSYIWEVKTKNGSTHYFGKKGQHSRHYAPLVKVVDKTGAAIEYKYTVGSYSGSTDPNADEALSFELDKVDYYSWDGDASSRYASVDFQYTPGGKCYQNSADFIVPTIGSRSDYTSGAGIIHGLNKLTAISIYGAKQSGNLYKRRKLALSYDASTESCSNASHTPYRQLTSIAETAYSPNISSGDSGSVVNMPATTFTYGKAGFYNALDRYEPAVYTNTPILPAAIQTGTSWNALGAKFGAQHPVDTRPHWKMIDVSYFALSPNTQTETSGGYPSAPLPRPLDYFSSLPRVLGADEGLSTLGTPDVASADTLSLMTSGQRQTRMFVDVNADGLPDLLDITGDLKLGSGISSSLSRCDIRVRLNDGNGNFAESSAFAGFDMLDYFADVPAGSDDVNLCSLNLSLTSHTDVPDGHPSINKSWEVNGQTFTNSWGAKGSVQRVAHAFIDVDKDGRVDLVSQPTMAAWRGYVSSHGKSSKDAGGYIVLNDGDWKHNLIECPLDKAQDLVSSCIASTTQTNWYVYRNNGGGFDTSPQIVKAPFGIGGGDFAGPHMSASNFDGKDKGYKTLGKVEPQSTMLDVNADGFVEHIQHRPDSRLWWPDASDNIYSDADWISSFAWWQISVGMRHGSNGEQKHRHGSGPNSEAFYLYDRMELHRGQYAPTGNNPFWWLSYGGNQLNFVSRGANYTSGNSYISYYECNGGYCWANDTGALDRSSIRGKDPYYLPGARNWRPQQGDFLRTYGDRAWNEQHCASMGVSAAKNPIQCWGDGGSETLIRDVKTSTPLSEQVDPFYAGAPLYYVERGRRYGETVPVDMNGDGLLDIVYTESLFADDVKSRWGREADEYVEPAEAALGLADPSTVKNRILYNRGFTETNEKKYHPGRLAWVLGRGDTARDPGGEWDNTFNTGGGDLISLQSELIAQGEPNFAGAPQSGSRSKATAVVDMDYDGLPEVMRIPQASGSDWSATLYVANGGPWLFTKTDIDPLVAFAVADREKYSQISNHYGLRFEHYLNKDAQLLDMNGDGLKDIVRYSSGQTEIRFAKPILDTAEDYAAPARLMRTVTNRFGGKTVISYERDTEAGRWVTAKTFKEGYEGTGEDMETRYDFIDPQFVEGIYGESKFAGYKYVARKRVSKTLSGSGITNLSEYVYPDQADYRPLLRREVSGRGIADLENWIGAGYGYDVQFAKEYDYRFIELLNQGEPHLVAKNYLPFRKESFSYQCSEVNSESLAACKASALSNSAWLKVTTTPVLNYGANGELNFVGAEDETTEFSTANGGAEKHRVYREYLVKDDGDNFAVVESKVEKYFDDGTGEQLAGRVQRLYNGSAYQFLVSEAVTAETGDVRTTGFKYYNVYGPHYGLLKHRTKPSQYGTPSPLRSTLEYDIYGVYVAKSTNELGHVNELVVDIASGATLEVRGPNYLCADMTMNGCTFDTAPYKETKRFDVDGFGREWAVEMNRLDSDSPGSFIQVSKTSHSLSQFTNQKAVQVLRSVDGADEVMRTQQTVFYDERGRVNQTVEGAKFTLYHYNELGKVDRIQVSDPSAQSTSSDLVQYEWAYDTLGRIISFREPADAGGTATRLAKTFWYSDSQNDRLLVVDNQLPLDNYAPAQKRVVRDMLGRMSSVAERIKAGEYATTNYYYDMLGFAEQIVDADGVTTDIVHNMLGERRAVSRGGRVWSYGYDADGNMTTVELPHNTGDDPVTYIANMQYDVLGRIKKFEPAQLELPAEAHESELFAYDPVDYYYDQVTPAPAKEYRYVIGRLASVETPTVRESYGYSAFGGVEKLVQESKLAVAGVSGEDETLMYKAQRNDGGQLELERLARITGQDENNYSWESIGPAQKRQYNLYGLLADASIEWNYYGDFQLADLSYNSAQKVIGRAVIRPDWYSPLSMQADYSYSTRGQILGQAISSQSGSTFALDVSYDYWDNGLVKSETQTGSTASGQTQVFDYGYDHMHQLTSAVSSGATAYSGAFGYTPGGRLQTAAVSTSGAAPVRVPAREVNYVYDSVHQEQLDRLENVADGASYADYTYDLMGNNTSRTQAGGSYDYIYDGSQRLRESQGPDGREVYHYKDNARVFALKYNAAGSLAEVRRWFGDTVISYKPGDYPVYDTQVSAGQTIARVRVVNGNWLPEVQFVSPQNHLLASVSYDGKVKRGNQYGPWGELLARQLGSGVAEDDHTKEFNGKDYDAVSGLHYYGYRYYDPVALMWNRQDPLYRFTPDRKLNDPRSANLYTFTKNNPVNLYDPDGLENKKPETSVQKTEVVKVETPEIVIYENTQYVDGIKFDTKVTGPAAGGAVETDGKTLKTVAKAETGTIKAVSTVTSCNNDNMNCVTFTTEQEGPKAEIETGINDNGIPEIKISGVGASTKTKVEVCTLSVCAEAQGTLQAGVSLEGQMAKDGVGAAGKLGPFGAGFKFRCKDGCSKTAERITKEAVEARDSFWQDMRNDLGQMGFPIF